MKTLISRTPVSSAAPFDFDAVKLHLRVDFDDDDTLIQDMAWTAAAELEQFAQLALLTQTVRVVVFDPGTDLDWRLPVGPVADDAAVTIAADGASFTDFTLVGGTRAMIRLGDSFLTLLPDRLTIEYPAGFGDAATDIPRDLAQAIMDQTALHYDSRGPTDFKSLTTSPHLARIAARYRGVQG
ncbi:head-tail connector protein [Maliponia aquimaris]|uniref:Phage gp6-like head-tail connector protein n=1 Tax=Maliponia aquimaris TaxID=1673631 RepID=A0A238KIL5_9RHOB|nr:head-tail connector protein [Maliponia aquimaris]SMX42527.1 hypothetical protein MAA8898_02637 [Maliponia aquimaris]